MKIRYYIDPSSGQPHIHNHDVDESEVEQVLENRGEDRLERMILASLSVRRILGDTYA